MMEVWMSHKSLTLIKITQKITSTTTREIAQGITMDLLWRKEMQAKELKTDKTRK